MNTRYTLLVVCLAVFFLATTSPANGDTIKLENGQTFEGEITAEEEERVQMKIAENGVRIWFPRNQIASLDKTEPARESEHKKDRDTSTKTGPDDDMVRARELLEKLREQPREDEKNQKKPPAKQATDQDTQASAPDANQSQIEKLIEQLRKGGKLDRMKACRKLEALRAQEAVPHLIKALDDDGVHVREAANKALITITGEDFGFQAGASGTVRQMLIKNWEDWYKEQQKKKAEADLKALW